ncbi:aminotransferase class III-fold pyridoxal phosphate-dependent enzyme, partial [Klebsiella pneumoniae]
SRETSKPLWETRTEVQAMIGKAAISDRTCAVIVEPIIGEGGVRPADPAFLQALRGYVTASLSQVDAAKAAFYPH